MNDQALTNCIQERLLRRQQQQLSSFTSTITPGDCTLNTEDASKMSNGRQFMRHESISSNSVTSCSKIELKESLYQLRDTLHEAFSLAQEKIIARLVIVNVVRDRRTKRKKNSSV